MTNTRDIGCLLCKRYTNYNHMFIEAVSLIGKLRGFSQIFGTAGLIVYMNLDVPVQLKQ